MLKKILKGLFGEGVGGAAGGGAKQLGMAGEDMAAKYLSNKGFKVLERNFRTRHGEVDIICADGSTLVFVEVKTRKSLKYGSPKEAVGRGKIARFTAAAKQYIARFGHDGAVRFDVLSIIKSNDAASIEHIEGAFDMPE